MTEKVKVGLVGAGPWANMVHAPILANHPDTELVAIWARRPDAAEELAAKHGAAVAPTFEQLLHWCDAVAFCVPPDIQATMAVTAARAGKTLLLEKPIALELHAAEKLAEAVDAAGVRSLVLLSFRYSDRVTEFIAEAATLGRILGGHGSMISGALKPGSPFATPWRLERGPLLDLGPHVVDLVDAAVGPVASVKATGDPRGWVSLLLEHTSGATSSVDLCANAGIGSITGVEVYGETGSVVLDGSRATDATSMMKVPKALAAAARGEPTSAPDVHRGLYLQKLLAQAERQLR